MDARDKDMIRTAQTLRDLCESRKNCTKLNGAKIDCPLMGDCMEAVVPREWDLPKLEEPQEPEPRKLKEIRTIKAPIDCELIFDEKVNEALAEDWILVKRKVIVSQTPDKRTALYAELVRYEND